MHKRIKIITYQTPVCKREPKPLRIGTTDTRRPNLWAVSALAAQGGF